MCLNIQQLCPSWLPSPTPSTTFTSSPVAEAHHIDSRLGTPLGMGAGAVILRESQHLKGKVANFLFKSSTFAQICLGADSSTRDLFKEAFHLLSFSLQILLTLRFFPWL